MVRVVEFFRDESFDPETVRVMNEAYEKVHKALHDRGQPPVVNEIIAKRIITAARNGIRDPLMLAEYAIRALGPKAVI